MKKYTALLLCAALAAGLCACDLFQPKPQPTTTAVETTATATEENTTREWTGEEIPVDKDKIITKDVVDYPEFHRDGGSPIAHSYILQKQESYLDRFYRVLYLAWPDFRDEISGPGAEKIKAYYAQAYEAAKPGKLDTSLYDYEFIADSPAEEYHYDYQDYSVELLERYLVVNFYGDWYGGGAHGGYTLTADVFNLQTGEKLTLEDFVRVKRDYAKINALAEAYLRENEVDTFSETFDIRETPPSSFTVTQDSLVLIYNQYEIAPYAAGTIEIPLPFAALGG